MAGLRLSTLAGGVLLVCVISHHSSSSRWLPPRQPSVMGLQPVLVDSRLLVFVGMVRLVASTGLAYMHILCQRAAAHKKNPLGKP